MERLRCCVSVPYRGYSFFNCRNGMVRSLRAQFPSITGVIRFLIQEDNLVSVCDKVSVPYRGYSFFNPLRASTPQGERVALFPSLTGVIRFLIQEDNLVSVCDKVSVPYRGYSFFNSQKFSIRTLRLNSFRPLQGLFVF